MSRQLKEVKSRIRNTRQIRRMTGTLQRVAGARLPGDRLAIGRSDRYGMRLAEVLDAVAAAAPEGGHAFSGSGGGSPLSLVVVFGSERGLCGGFNSSLLEPLRAFMRERGAERVQAIVVGKVASRRVGRMGLHIREFVHQPIRDRRADVIDGLASGMIRAFREGAVGEVWLLFARFVSALKHVPTLERLLPVGTRPAAGSGEQPFFEPDPRQILDELLPEYVRQRVDAAFLHSLGSEDAARESAMSRATDNAGRMLEELRRRHSRLRQESITTEMIELASGGLS